MSDATFEQIIRLVIVGILGVISYFLKRVMGQLDHLTEELQTLEVKVAIILDRDRQKRLQDYNGEHRKYKE